MKEIIAANVAALMERHNHDPKAAAKHLKIARYQLTRILAGAHYPRTDTLQRIADGYDIEPYQLLIANLDPKNAQVPRVLSPEDEKLYKALDEARKAPPGGAH